MYALSHALRNSQRDVVALVFRAGLTDLQYARLIAEDISDRLGTNAPLLREIRRREVLFINKEVCVFLADVLEVFSATVRRNGVWMSVCITPEKGSDKEHSAQDTPGGDE